MRILPAAFLLSLLLVASALAGESASVRGTVRSADGKPLVGAHVLAVVKSWPGGRFLLTPHHAVTDGKGRFALEVLEDPSGKYFVNAAVLAEGHVLESRYEESPGVLELELSLAPAVPLKVRFLDEKGEPVAGVTAWVSGRKTPEGGEHLVYARGSEPIRRLSDRKGEVPFACFAKGDRARIAEIRPGGGGMVEREFEVTGEKDQVVELRPKGEMAEETLLAGKDERKQFFLFGPRPDDAKPKDGYGLVLVLPGGSGAASFKNFVLSIYEQSVPPGYVLAELVAVKWTPDQEIVWPTERDRVKGAKFTTEEFIDAIVKDVGKRLDLDRRKVLTLSWSSGGPAAYAAAFRKRTPITGSFVAMSVFYPAWFPNLKPAKGKPFYILHSPEDDVCRFPLAEDARDRLGKVGARVEFETYEGGHGWPPATRYELLTAGFRWLDEQVSKER